MTAEPKMADFEKDGKVDWAAYNRAQIDYGIKCRTCKQYTSVFGARGYPRECSDCEAARKRTGEEVTHDRYVRCPACMHLFEPDMSEFRGEGETEFMCPECEHEFEATANVSVSWTSPPANPKPPEPEPESDEEDESEE